jgi:hypothetical protein
LRSLTQCQAEEEAEGTIDRIPNYCGDEGDNFKRIGKFKIKTNQSL